MTYLLLAQLALSLQQSEATPPSVWFDNNRQFNSEDPKLNVRRSEHFRIVWGQGLGEGGIGADYGRVTEQLVQGNLQMLEQVWHFYHDAPPVGLGFHIPWQSSNLAQRDGKAYRATIILHNTGIWEGGAWGTCDEWGIPLMALSPPFLSFDPPSSATPHEYAHATWINAAGFNDTPYDGMWHEAMANWSALQFNNSYPGPGGVGSQPYLSLPHGRNYYDAWQLWEYFRENKRYGIEFSNKLWLEAKGRDKEYIFDAIARLHPTGTVDPKNTVKDILGEMAAKAVTWDYERGMFFRNSSPRDGDFFKDIYRRGYTELERVGDSKTWYRCPLEEAPMQGGYNLVPIALTGKTGGGYGISVDFRPYWDPTRGADYRATLVAVSDNGDPKYSSTWNQGCNSITLSKDENKLYLVVAATPELWPFDGFSRPKPSDPTLQPQAYEVAFVDTKAEPFESHPVPPAGVKGHRHGNGGGFVADTASVQGSAFVGPNAMVLDSAQVKGSARIEDYAVVRNSAVISGNAVVSGHAMVRDRAEVLDDAKVRDWATVGGSWKVFEHGRAFEHAYLTDRGQLHGYATIQGVTADFGNADVKGYAIKDGDCANSANVDKQVLMCWVWGIDQKYADEQPDAKELYCNYTFEKPSPIYALDRFGLVHGVLRNNAIVQACSDPKRGQVLSLDGEKQYVELRRQVADLDDGTVAVWVKANGQVQDEQIFSFGDGTGRYAYLTANASKSGCLEFVISNGGKAKEQRMVAKALPYAKWTHVAVTLSGDSGTLYVDGKAVVRNPKMTLNWQDVLPPNLLSSSNCFYLGKGFTGLMDDFRVYVKPQSAEVIASLAGEVTDRTAGSGNEGPIMSPAAPEFLQKPTITGSSVTMSVKRIDGDSKWIEYKFTRGDGKTSGWISTNRWVDTEVLAGKLYRYSARRRDVTGNLSKGSVAATVELPMIKRAIPEGAFAKAPHGISETAIRMSAIPHGGMEYRFTREDGKTTGWQASPSWTDSNIQPGAKHSYTVQVRYGISEGKVSAAHEAIARDDTPPEDYFFGGWQTRPYASISNEVAMRAMSVTGQFGLPRLEESEVEYSFECVKGGGPNSGWIKEPFFKTSALTDGRYYYRFKMRDLSPQKNETLYSSTVSTVVSSKTGYHPLELSQLANLEEGTLVQFTGEIEKVEIDHYVVRNGESSIKVNPQTKGAKTDAALVGKKVTVKGGVWIVSGEKRVTWAEIKGT